MIIQGTIIFTEFWLAYRTVIGSLIGQKPGDERRQRSG